MSSITDTQDREKQEILKKYRGLMRVCMDWTSKEDRKTIRRAMEYAMNAHQGARRKSGEPYIFHPIAVAKIVVTEIGLDVTSVIAALLHDVVEDTFAEVKDIRMEFGREVAGIVDGLTKISGVFDHKSSAQAENFRKMLLTLSDDFRVILIKLADRLHNMRTLQYMKKESQLKIASETLYLYAPLANRLGLHEIKSELEDLALKYTEPSIYIEINQALKKNQRESKYYIQNFIRSIREKLSEGGLKIKILHRFKTVFSVYSKMIRQGIPFDEVYDLFAVRIIIDSPVETEKADCWKAYSLITEKYKPNPDRLRDWITIPKANGYEALHCTVMGPRGRWIEVQIRSTKMDHVAEKGFAAHWRYKDTDAMDTNMQNWLDHVRELLESPHMNAIDVVNEFKTNLVTEEVFVFTPIGDLITLPAKATVIDFAYEIHTRVGDTCIGAKVNNKVVPLSYELSNGDQVEIITSAKQTPKDDWVNYARTSKAKHKIKDALKKERRIVTEKGRELFTWKAEQYGVDENGFVMKELLAFLKIRSKDEFFYRLGSHKLDVGKLSEFIRLKKEGLKFKVEHPDPEQRNQIRNRKEVEELLKSKWGIDSDMLMIGEDMDISEYKFANCCQPIPGDDVLGFYMPEEGVLVHRTNCPEAIRLMSNYGHNIIKAKWTEMQDITFLAGIKIIGEDRKGMMNDLIKVMSIQMKLNIRSITIDSLDGMFEGSFKIFINDARELNKLSKQLKNVRGVFSVSRIEDMA